LNLTLIHNEKAGAGKYTRSELVELLRQAGHRVAAFSPKRDDVKEAFKRAADLIVIAGGDGAATSGNRASAGAKRCTAPRTGDCRRAGMA
jgi:diacylglycerol kinase family enzyme